MNLTEYHQNIITQVKDVPGLLRAEVEHEIKQSSGRLLYDGPKIPWDVWRQVLSFFKWTHTTTSSESQVRLFVNTELQTWAAWAFPQQARTGMSALEINTNDTDIQRRQFADTAGWLYFGTVHHHCNTGAFQSGTDESDERQQHGIHITVGKMGEDLHDLHVRFYLKDMRFDVDMSMFWDIGSVGAITPPEVHDRIARYQMCLPSSVEFPQQWKDNLIEAPKPVSLVPAWSGGSSWQGSNTIAPFYQRKIRAVAQIALSSAPMDDLRDMLELLSKDEACRAIITAVRMHDVSPSDIMEEMDSQADTEADQIFNEQ